MRSQGLWLGFFDAFDVGSGADRVEFPRCVSIAEAPLADEAEARRAKEAAKAAPAG